MAPPVRHRAAPVDDSVSNTTLLVRNDRLQLNWRRAACYRSPVSAGVNQALEEREWQTRKERIDPRLKALGLSEGANCQRFVFELLSRQGRLSQGKLET
jgi:hypothetical protein